MKRRIMLVLCVLLIAVLTVFTTAVPAAAQAAGCLDASGGPIPCTPTPSGPQDIDADGVPDAADLCPSVGGSNSNNGCPVDNGGTPAAPTTAPASVPPTFPDSRDCLISPMAETVNIRQLPSTNAAVIGTLAQGSFATALVKVINGQGELWYFISPTGYVRADTVYINGNCGDLRTFTILQGAREVQISGELLAGPDMGGDEGAPPPDNPTCYRLVIINGQAYCLVTVPPTLTGVIPGTEGAPPPDPNDCTYWVVIDGQVICFIGDATDFAAAGGSSEGAPPPPEPDCDRLVIIDGQAYCFTNYPLSAGLNPSQGAPPPDPNDCTYWVVVDGQAICLIGDATDLASPLTPPEGAPPPEPNTCHYWVVIDGQVICLIGGAVDLAMAGGSSEGAPPPEPNTCSYWIVIDGQVICLIGGAVDLAMAGGSSENTQPPPEPDCDRLVIIDGQAYCFTNFPLSSGPGAGPLPQTREHILLARQVGTPAECPNMPTLTEGAFVNFPGATIPMQDLLPIPPDQPCTLELMFPSLGPDGLPQGTVNADGSVRLIMDVVILPQ